MTEMRIASIASGSKGNAYLVEQEGEAVLIDCGICFKTLRARVAALYERLGAKPPHLNGVLVTHSHTDHVGGLRPLLSKRGVTVYANSMTAETVACQEHLDDSAFACFENGQPFSVGPFEVAAFSIPHDTSDPVGFLIKDMAAGETYFHGTDIGTPLDSIGVKLAEADIATLESNHDSVMLATSGRHPSLIRRISGPRGHLSNDQACELVRRFASPRLRKLALAHLSRDCNAPRLAEEAMKATLLEMDRADVELKVFGQDETVVL